MCCGVHSVQSGDLCVLWRAFSAVWGLEDYYDATMAKREAHQLLMKNVERSCTTSVSSDGVELIEMPLRYDRCVACDWSVVIIQCF